MLASLIDAAHYSDKGPNRPRNEDSVACLPDAGIFIVADGVGGVGGGELASKVAVETLAGALRAPTPPPICTDQLFLLGEGEADLGVQAVERARQLLPEPGAHLLLACLAAHFRVVEEGCRAGLVGMSTTAVVAWLREHRLWISHVGDCRAYLLEEDRLSCLTEDHRVTATARHAGLPEGEELTPFLCNRPTLTQVVGGGGCPTIPDICSLQPAPGARCLLCSDGAWGSLSEEEITAVLTHGESAAAISRTLVEMAIAQGSKDNVTALVFCFDGQDRGPGLSDQVA